MESLFFSENKDFWGCNFNNEGKIIGKITRVTGPVLKKIIDYSFEERMPVNFLPMGSSSCVFIKTPLNVWHYFCSKEEAERVALSNEFYKNSQCC